MTTDSSPPAGEEVRRHLAALPLPLAAPDLVLGEIRHLLEPPCLPLPAAGDTLRRFAVLAEIARHDLVLARLAEGHADAIAILAEASAAGVSKARVPAGGRLGVWAAGPLDELALLRRLGHNVLVGRRRWCSGAGALTHALVTATGAGDIGASLVLVDLRRPGVSVDTGSWSAIGMARSDTFEVRFDEVPIDDEDIVATGGWYTSRPGFFHGATGVAACWWGGAAGLTPPLERRCRDADDPHARAALGASLAELWAMECCLTTCATRFDLDPLDARREARRLAELTRLLVENAATRVLRLVGAATGAEPLGHDAAHAQRVADLTVYLRQHHGPRDAEGIARVLLEPGTQ